MQVDKNQNRIVPKKNPKYNKCVREEGNCKDYIACFLRLPVSKILFSSMFRKLPTAITELTKHTHQSAWHSMHNVICGGAKFTDKHLETLINSGVRINVVQGDRDAIVPIDCLWNMKAKFPAVEVEVIAGTDHSTVIMSRREVFIANLVSLWSSSGEKQNKLVF